MVTRRKEICPLNIGFISTRFSGTDGVSLETAKWASVLTGMGHHCFYLSGESDKPPEVSRVAPLAFFQHPEIAELQQIAFSSATRPPRVTARIQEIKAALKSELDRFCHDFDLQLLIVENALAIPMNIPLGLALTEYLIETGFPAIAHHHDFYWERSRFLVNCVWDYLRMAFPPPLTSIKHVVINTSGAFQLAVRTGISSRLIPNVMDFDHPPLPPDEYAYDLKTSFGLEPGEKLVLQPTRVVKRKGIENAIELVSHLGIPASLIVSHAAGDEGTSYERHLITLAERLGVKALFCADQIQNRRGLTPQGAKIYTLQDVYLQADLVTYPSDVEGFGNAFLEAIYYKRPVVVNNYAIFNTDIRPHGFQVIDFDGFVDETTIEKARTVLLEPAQTRQMVESNYRAGRRHYSFSVLRRHLELILAEIFGE